jgi:hypothetical protein
VSVWLGRDRISTGKLPLLGVGGEAEVFALPDGRALKLFKGPDHPDLKLFPEQRDAAAARLELHQDKLRMFPTGLPERVVTPDQLATGGLRRRRVLGYAMRKIDGVEHLMHWGNPRRRRAAISAARVVEVLLDLHRTLAALHQRGVVIGDFNDLNVLVGSDGAAHLIDADSFSFAGFVCAVFTERFVDPLLCDPSAAAPVLVQPHNPGSDWYAFTIMVMRCLLCVGPYGGVFRPGLGEPAVAHAARPLRRISVFDPRVLYPKPALPIFSLPDELLEHLRGVFIEDRRAPFPRALLESLVFARCRSCGLEHAHPRCPACTTRLPLAPPTKLLVRGKVRVEWLPAEQARILTATLDRAGESPPPLVDIVDGRPALACHGDRRVWICGGRVLTDHTHGPRELGRVLEGRTRVWLGPRFGLALYSVGALPIPASFDPTRPGLSDGRALAPIRGRIVHAGAQLSATHAWLFMLLDHAGRLRLRRDVLGRDAGVLGSAQFDAEDHASGDAWIRSLDGATASGSLLLVPTDAGIVRVELVNGQPQLTRTFPDTAPFVDAASTLLAGPTGLLIVDSEGVRRIEIT